ncbi:MAG: T9SS-dependent M36 family metallopeptidase [Bacteroidia bacterium]|nr:T9SS-dependent M36 family metallopeptidase [Bacteroidia bacterium]
MKLLLPNLGASSAKILLCFGIIASFLDPAHAQVAREVAISYIQQKHDDFGLTAEDLGELLITDEYVSGKSGNTHIYLRQAHQGIGIYGANMNICLGKNQEVLVLHNAAFQGIASRIRHTSPALSPEEALRSVALQFAWPTPSDLTLIQAATGADSHTILQARSISEEKIPMRLMYVMDSNGQLRLSWDLSVLTMAADHWWSIRVDAITGEILDQLDWMLSCQFGPAHEHRQSQQAVEEPLALYSPSFFAIEAANSYNVFAEPVESPSHGARSIKTSPWNLTASPFGWHDTNGAAGAEYTITRGNNVLAQEDANGNNGTGYSPDGGPTLDFDFPLNLNQNPAGYQDAAITNLFYWNNLIHDFTYLYGFDEVSGNFQENNYGKGGNANDYVLADAQDGSGVNNANFGTPADGSNPRMQMFLWSGSTQVIFNINAPAGIAGSYTAIEAAIGPGLSTTPITADLVLVDDGSATPTLGCNPLTNAAAISGKIALVDRGGCTFAAKILNAQNSGALACVVCNNVAGTPIAMGGVGTGITIPSVMISQADCDLIKAQLAAGVNLTLYNTGTVFDLDGDFDNGIIAHEYGHGISNRLTGGPSNVNCLGNAEQMGEGWSDFFGLVMTMKATDQGTNGRGIGTYAISQPTTGGGIRPAPYSTNMAINPFTYGDISNTTAISQPHGVGFLWCTMLWEMTWNLIDDLGFDADLMYGSGGNNVAMELVMEGMRLQPCSPGFVSGRDAILAADTILYGGSHGCAIWSAFSKRGLGLGASQGSVNSRTDGFEAFDLPPTACSVLPVEWVSLSATPQESAISLSWEVSREIDNDGFFVDRRSENTQRFEELGFVSANAGNPSSSTYHFVDRQVAQGITYSYRLRQRDLDGAIAYSSVVEARIEPKSSLVVDIFPNPSQGILHIELQQPSLHALELTVFDLVGKELRSKRMEPGEMSSELNLGDLGAGIYLLKLGSGGIQTVRRIVIE